MNPNPQTAVTLCICVKNGEDSVGRCLESIARQTLVISEVIVVDHSSTDRTPAILAEWVARCSWLKVFRFDGHGLAAARDFAWRQARSPWVAFTDADCELSPDWFSTVAQHVRMLASKPKVGAFGGAASVPVQGPALYDCFRLFLPTFIGGHDSVLNRSVTEMRSVVHLPTLNVVYRQEALQCIGGFRSQFVRVGEDLDVSLRLREVEYYLLAIPGMDVVHYLRSSLNKWLRNMFLYGRGRVTLAQVNHVPLEVKFLIPLLIVCSYGVATLVAPLLGLALSLVHLGSIALLLFPRKWRLNVSILVWLYATVVLWLTHLAYGLGMIRQTVAWGKRVDPPLPSAGIEKEAEKARKRA